MIKKILLFFMVAVAPAQAQKGNAVAEAFLKSANEYDAENLKNLLTDDFQQSYTYVDMTIDKKEFVGEFLGWLKRYHAGYDIDQTVSGDNPAVYLVKDHSIYLKFLNIQSPDWKITITTKDKQVSKILIDSTAGFQKYSAELSRKDADFIRWKNDNFPESAEDSNAENYYRLLKMYSELPESERTKRPEPEPEIETAEPEADEPEPQYAQPMSPAESAQFDADLACKHRNKYNAARRMAFYPFNKAKKVALISFSDDTRYGEYVSKTNKVPNMSVAKSKKILSKPELDKLTDIIYNTGFTVLTYSKTIAEPCPDLKNAIVFLDANGKPFEYIGLYFGCDITEYSSEKVKDGEYCAEKYALLKKFFESAGIQTGRLE